MHASEFLESAEKHAAKPFAVFSGGEAFLVRTALAALRRAVLGDEIDRDLALARFDAGAVRLSDVLDALSTAPLFGGRRLVVVDDADAFVTRYRAALERYADAPSSRALLA
jgi:DNA polymerase-3 subunit delta